LRSRRPDARVLLAAVASPLFLGFDCGGSLTIDDTVAAPTTWTNDRGTLSVDILPDPLRIVVKGKDGATLLESTDLPDPADDADPMRAYAPFAMTHNTDETVPGLDYGWNYYRGEDGPWK
jgi:hypothetical protein